MSENTLPLNDLLQAMKRELAKAQEEAVHSNMKFSIESVELELSVGVTKTGTGEGGVEFYVFKAGAKYEEENATIQKLTLVLKPDADWDGRVSNKTGKKPSRE